MHIYVCICSELCVRYGIKHPYNSNYSLFFINVEFIIWKVEKEKLIFKDNHETPQQDLVGF